MKAALALMVVAGIAIGLMLPGAKTPVVQPAGGLVTTPQSAPPPRNPDLPRGTVLTRDGNGHFYAAAEVNGRPTRFMVDTGASGIALTMADAQAAGVAIDRSRFEQVGTGAGGAVFGQRVSIRSLAMDGKQASDLTAVVVDGLTVSLLGQGYLSTLDMVEIKGDTMVLR